MTRRTRRGVLAVLMVVALLVGVFAVVPSVGATPAAAAPTTQMVICLDASNSIDSATWGFMTTGVANAIRTVVPHDGSVELGVNKFGWTDDGMGDAAVVVPMQVISSDAVANAVAVVVAAESKTAGWTPTGKAIELASAMMQGSTNWQFATRHIINVVTDGQPAQAGDPGYEAAKAAAVAARNGFTANANAELHAELVPALKTGVIAPADVNWWLENMVYPEPGGQGKLAPPFDPVHCGFVAKCYNATDIVNAIKGKIDCVKLTLTQESDRNPVNTWHSVTATLTDALNNPIRGVKISFKVSGHNAIVDTVTTGENGIATFKYQDMTGTEGTDTIVASYPGYDCAEASVTKKWFEQTQPPPVPSVTTWGMIATIAALAGIGSLVLLRKQARLDA